jgi:tetratricopeptide (TPR) repeat protein
MDLTAPEGRQQLGRRIQSAIAGAGYDSLPGFAQELGCSRALIYQYVSGHVLAQLDRLQLIGDLTGRPLEWFFSTDPSATTAEVRELRERLSAAEARAAEFERALAAERKARMEQTDHCRRLLMEATRDLCLAWRRAGDPTSMLTTAPRWLALAQECGDERSALDAQLQMAYAWFHTGDPDQAKRALAEVLEKAQALGDARAEQAARQELTRALQASGHLEEAREQARQVAASNRWWPRWSGLLSLAAIEEQVGNLDEAETQLRAAEKVVEEGEAPADQRTAARAYVESNRVNISLARGRYERALRQSESLRLLVAQANLPDQMREAVLNSAICHLRLGHLDEAGEQLERLLDWATMSGDRRSGALARVFESERRRRCGDLSLAKKLALAAAEQATEARNGHLLGEAELALAQAYLAEGRPDDARYHLGRCVNRAQRLRVQKLEVAARLALARVADAEGAADAAAQLTDVATMSSELGYEDLSAEALEASGTLKEQTE